MEPLSSGHRYFHICLLAVSVATGELGHPVQDLRCCKTPFFDDCDRRSIELCIGSRRILICLNPVSTCFSKNARLNVARSESLVLVPFSPE